MPKVFGIIVLFCKIVLITIALIIFLVGFVTILVGKYPIIETADVITGHVSKTETFQGTRNVRVSLGDGSSYLFKTFDVNKTGQLCSFKYKLIAGMIENYSCVSK